MVRTNKNNVALAGEFAVLSRLALYNYDANMTLGRTKGVDILVSNPRNHKMYRLEVKTKLRRHDNEQNNSTIFGRYFAGWMMHKRARDQYRPSSILLLRDHLGENPPDAILRSTEQGRGSIRQESTLDF